jgi:hypothetical protein
MPTPVFIRAVLWLWLLTAVYLGHTHKLAGTHAATLPLLMVGLAGAFLLLGRLKLVRDWFNGFDLRALVLLSTTRFVALYFLHLFTLGELPAQFAFVFGWSESLIAASALVVGAAPLKPALRHRVVGIWNIVGFIGLALLTFNLTSLALSDRAIHALLTQLPLVLLPAFLLPLLLATHVLIHRRLAREAA